MTDSLGTLLTAMLQKRGIYADDFQTITTAVFDSLYELDKQILPGESLIFPAGNEYIKR